MHSLSTLRIETHGEGDGTMVLGTGELIPCDFLIFVAPVGILARDLLAPKFIAPARKRLQILSLAFPDIISPLGECVMVKPTLQIADDRFGNIYAAGVSTRPLALRTVVPPPNKEWL